MTDFSTKILVYTFYLGDITAYRTENAESTIFQTYDFGPSLSGPSMSTPDTLLVRKNGANIRSRASGPSFFAPREEHQKFC